MRAAERSGTIGAYALALLLATSAQAQTEIAPAPFVACDHRYSFAELEARCFHNDLAACLLAEVHADRGCGDAPETATGLPGARYLCEQGSGDACVYEMMRAGMRPLDESSRDTARVACWSGSTFGCNWLLSSLGTEHPEAAEVREHLHALLDAACRAGGQAHCSRAARLVSLTDEAECREYLELGAVAGDEVARARLRLVPPSGDRSCREAMAEGSSEACAAGDAAACYDEAWRLRTRAQDVEDLARAHDFLLRACDLGSEYACGEASRSAGE